MSTYAVKIYLTAEDIYNKLSDEDKKRFNKAIITDVKRDEDTSVEITCVLVNDFPFENNEDYNFPCRSKYIDGGNVVPSSDKMVLNSTCSHKWELTGVNTAGSQYVCRICGATKTESYNPNHNGVTIC